MLVPISYNLRSLFVRRSSTLLTVLGIGATVATVAGVLALQQGFATLYAENGQEGVAVLMRQGAISEGVSMLSRDKALKMVKTVPEIAAGTDGQPLASMECFLAVRLFKVDGGETNVPVRGVQPKTFEIRGDAVRMAEGRRFETGSDEIIVGRKLLGRIPNCNVGDVLELNVTPFRVVGVFECDGPFESEIWGDFDRMLAALQRYGPNRVLAELQPGTDVDALAARMETDKDVPARVMTERDYLSSQTEMMSFILVFLGAFLGVIMGVAAIFTAINTMLSAIASRTHEIGVLLATGFRPVPIFLSFMTEALMLGLLGGVAGCLMTLPLNGIRTGTTNFQTFTEVAFAFRVTPTVLGIAVIFSVALGLVGGAFPAWRAASMTPTEALRRR
jgi:putative ABC transport system permease protein